MREIILDTETTGLNPLTGDRMVEIGCVEMFNRCETGRTFHAYYNPCRPMPSDAEAVHGLSDVFLSDKPLFGDVCEELIAFIGDSPIIAHNAPFDFGFLNHELAHCGRKLVCMTRMVDTLPLARQRLPGAKHSLDALCSRYGVDRSIRIKHGALIDAQLLAQVYVELTGGRQIGLGLVAEAAPARARIDKVIVEPFAAAAPRGRIPPVHAPSAAELARHADFLMNLSNPLWAQLSQAA